MFLDFILNFRVISWKINANVIICTLTVFEDVIKNLIFLNCRDVQNSRPKIRKRAAQTQELLFGESATTNNDDMSRSYTIHEGRSLIPLARVPSAPGSLK